MNRVRVGALVAVLGVGLAIPLLRTQLAPAPDERPPPAPAPDIGRMQPPVVYDLDFADAHHGFALWGRCTDGRDFVCERKLLVTEDGTHWSHRPFADAELSAPQRLDGRVVALDARRIMLTELDDSASRTRFYSADAGQTWREVSATPERTVAGISDGGILETQCVETVHDLTECRRRRVVVTLPDSGQRAWLANPPALDHPSPERRALSDGSWWVSGKDPSSGRWAVAVSRDAGRSWATAQLPIPTGAVLDRFAITGTGADVYALAIGSLPASMRPHNLLAIFRSTDGGRSWARTWLADGTSPRSLGDGAIVTPDGGLFIASEDVGPPYRSVDGGHTFTPLLDAPRLTAIRRTRAGYLATPANSPPGHYVISTDGVHWADIPLP